MIRGSNLRTIMTRSFLNPYGTDSIEHKPFKCTWLILNFSRMVPENTFFSLQLVFIHSFILKICILHRALWTAAVRTHIDPVAFINITCNFHFKSMLCQWKHLTLLFFFIAVYIKFWILGALTPKTFGKILEELFHFYLLRKVNDDWRRTDGRTDDGHQVKKRSSPGIYPG